MKPSNDLFVKPGDLNPDQPWGRPIAAAVPEEEFDRNAEKCPEYLHRLAAHQEAEMAHYRRPVVWLAGTFWEVHQ